MIVLFSPDQGSGSSAQPSFRLRDLRDGGDTSSLLEAVRSSRSALRSRKSAELRVLETLEAALRAPKKALGGSLEARLRARPEVPVLLTGYYEPTLSARLASDARFRFPLFRPPPGELGHPSRREIEAGALAGRGLEMFWVDDPIEAFFLHVQGSGRLELADGQVVRIGYAGSNGLPYKSIGAELVSRGVFRPAEATAPAIKRYLRANPQQITELLPRNQRYVYFRVLDVPAESGPPGALGVPLVPYRSVATDPAVTPPGSVGFLEATLPDGRDFSSLVVAMDTGVAIRGPGRIDLFLGAGPGTDWLAGELRSSGRVRWLELR